MNTQYCLVNIYIYIYIHIYTYIHIHIIIIIIIKNDFAIISFYSLSQGQLLNLETDFVSNIYRE